MAQWYHLFGLLSVMCMSFGALYIIFQSKFDEVCDYSDTVETCSELKEYKPDIGWDQQMLFHDWRKKAQELRNDTEIQKCKIETDLLTELQDYEKKEAQKIVTKCLADFKTCVSAGYSTTTPAPTAVDCTACNRFCQTTNWALIDKNYASVMGFNGMCGAKVCPWMPSCGAGKFIHEKCSARGCQCNKNPCTTTSTTTTVTTTTTETTTTTSTTTTSTTSTTNTTTSTTLTTTTTGTTTTSTTTTTTSTTSTTTTTTTSTTTSTTTTPPTTTTSTTSTSTTTTSTTTTTTSTTTIGCFCDPGLVDTVMVGRPYKTWQGSAVTFTHDTAKYWQGVLIESFTRLPVGGMLTKSCNAYFSNRSTYAGPRTFTNPARAAAARNSHIDLGCGYSGLFNMKCSQTPAQVANGTCSLKVDISTCQPPTYTQALDSCYAIPTTTTRRTGPTLPTVPDWLGVQDINFSLAPLPKTHDIVIPTVTTAPCCEVHVGSVCRTEEKFPGTINGTWSAMHSYNRQFGYFPVRKCGDQAKSLPRPCPRVKINQISSAFLQWPHCLHKCSPKMAQDKFKGICNRTARKDMEEKEKAAHKKKIDLMKAGRETLEAWTKTRMTTVTETKNVIDCFADNLPRRYNGMALPAVRSGFEKMPLHNLCRLHKCTAKQCLTVKNTCRIPYVHESPEELCPIHRPNGTFECIDKVSIWSNNPMSMGFGAAWIVMGAVFACAGVATFVKAYTSDPGPGGPPPRRA